MASLFDITLSDVTVTEGGSVTITLTPIAAITGNVTVSWSILGFGRLPTSGGDFSNLSGSVSFVAGASAAQTFTLTPTDDASGELPKEFLVRLSQDAGGTVTELGDHAVMLNDNDAPNYLPRFPRATPENDVVVMEGTTGSGSFSGAVGADVLVITRHQYGDVTINDTLGNNTVKFDYGVEVLSFTENLRFGNVAYVTINLASGAEITVTAPAQQGRYQYQFGDEAAMDYAAFKAAVTAPGLRLITL